MSYDQYSDLLDFIRRQMRMQAVYQPVLIRTLLQHGGRSSVSVIAGEIQSEDNGRLGNQLDYERIVRKLPGRVLSDRGCITYTESLDQYQLNIDVGSLSAQELDNLIMSCEDRISSYLSNESESPVDTMDQSGSTGGRNEWSDDELFETVKVYMEMLDLEQSGHPYSKTDFRGRLMAGPLSGRSRSTIEYRMQNISSYRLQRGMNWIEGYKPMSGIGANIITRLDKLFQRYESEEFGYVSVPTNGSANAPTGGPSRGLTPRSAGYEVEPTNPSETEGFVYIAQYGITDVFKFGYSGDLARRLEEFNQYVPTTSEIPNHPQWRMRFHSHELTTDKAYGTEQEIKEKLTPFLTEGERFICPPEILTSVARSFNLIEV